MLSFQNSNGRRVKKKPVKLWRWGALLVVSVCVALAIGVALPLPQFALAPPDTRPLVIDDVSIVDLQAGVVHPGQMIVIADGRIVHAGAKAAAPANARRISGSGKYAMPGLWDMHVHTVGLSPELHFPLLLANGVTAIRDMGDGCSFSGKMDCLADAPQWQQQAAAGTLLAPRLLSTASYHVEEAQDGLVAALAKRGDRMLKLQLDNDADPALFYAMLQQAQAAGMQAAGHLPYRIDLLDPALPALSSIEHDDSLPLQCARRGTPFDGRNRAKLVLLKQPDQARCDAVFGQLARRAIAYVPTHVASSGQDWLLLSGAYRRDERVRYAALPQRLLWRGYAAIAVAGTGADDGPLLQAWHNNSLQLTVRAVAAGVPVMAGSDAIDAYVTHGFGLHDELALLVGAGLTPLQALRAAITVPAAHTGLSERYGSVATGKMADLLLLNKNPLNDIAHARSIDSVFHEGRLYQRKDLDAMLAFVETQAGSYSVNSKFVWAMLRPW